MRRLFCHHRSWMMEYVGNDQSWTSELVVHKQYQLFIESAGYTRSRSPCADTQGRFEVAVLLCN